jgi:hypothetical protein
MTSILSYWSTVLHVENGGKTGEKARKGQNFGVCPLHKYQYAYQPRKSAETTTPHALTHMEEAVENRVVGKLHLELS